MVGLVVAFLLMTSFSPVSGAEKREKKSNPPTTVNMFKAKGKNIAFTCSPSNCREQQDGSYLFNLSCQTNNENDKLDLYLGDQGRTIQSFGPIDLIGDIKAPKKGSVPIKISASEDENSPKVNFTFKYTVDQIKRPTCRKYGELEL